MHSMKKSSNSNVMQCMSNALHYANNIIEHKLAFYANKFGFNLLDKDLI